MKARILLVIRASIQVVLAALNPKAMGRYWLEHRDHIRGLELQSNGRCAFMPGYTAFYRDDLDGVFAVLDELADEAATALLVADE